MTSNKRMSKDERKLFAALLSAANDKQFNQLLNKLKPKACKNQNQSQTSQKP
jgi:hypothetical protein